MVANSKENIALFDQNLRKFCVEITGRERLDAPNDIVIQDLSQRTFLKLATVLSERLYPYVKEDQRISLKRIIGNGLFNGPLPQIDRIKAEIFRVYQLAIERRLEQILARDKMQDYLKNFSLF